VDETWHFHHLGVACASIDRAASAYTSLGYQLESTFEDPIQGVRGAFYVGNGPRYELLSDLPDRQTVAPWILRRMPTVYHQAWLVPDLDAALGTMQSAGGRPTGDAAASVYFKGPIVFVMTRAMVLVELIQPGPDFDLGVGASRATDQSQTDFLHD
jgi:methylmalonyl-CoA/ethylmalonyl-CoA epimerase